MRDLTRGGDLHHKTLVLRGEDGVAHGDKVKLRAEIRMRGVETGWDGEKS